MKKKAKTKVKPDNAFTVGDLRKALAKIPDKAKLYIMANGSYKSTVANMQLNVDYFSAYDPFRDPAALNGVMLTFRQ